MTTRYPKKLILFTFAFMFLYAQRWTPEDDFNHIKTFDAVLNKTVAELSKIRPITKDNNEYFTNKQYDDIEALYFRYTLCTRSLVDIVNAYKDLSNRSKHKKNNVQPFDLDHFFYRLH